MTGPGFDVVPDQLRQQSEPVAGAAEQLKEIEPVATGALTNGDLLASAVLAPDTAFAAEKAILHSVTNGDGLGLAFAGSGVADVVDGVGTALGGDGLAERIAADALMMRIAAVTYEHPELANNEKFNELVNALDGDNQAEAARILAGLVTDPDAMGMGDLAPILPELLALNALLDENPLNDSVGWDLLNGRTPSVDPITGLINLESISGFFDSGPGHAEQIGNPDGLRSDPSMDGFLDNISTLGNEGQIVIQTVRGPDGVDRYVVQLPGMQFGNPSLDHPQDLAGAMHNALADESAYTRAVQQAMQDAGIPPGADVMLVGHSLGGIAASNLAQDPAFNGGQYNVTHVISAGSPVDGKDVPAGSGTQPISIVNDRDMVPALDGRGAGSPSDPAGGRQEYRYSSPDQFPDSHGIDVYRGALAGEYGAVGPDGRPLGEYLDGQLYYYTGGGARVVDDRTYQLHDHPPED